MAIPWGPIITGASSILSGLFGRKKEKPQTQTSVSTVNYQGMVDAAEAAGFNPLTAIRNGGTAGWTTTTGTTSGGGGGSGGGSAISAIAGGLSAGLSQWAQSYDPMRDKLDQVRYDILNEQLGDMRAKRGPMDLGSFTNVPVRPASHAVTGTGPASRPAGAAMEMQGHIFGVAPPGPAKIIASETGPIDSREHSLGTGYQWRTYPGRVPAETVENEYGDVASWVYGLYGVAQDAAYNARPALRHWASGDENKAVMRHVFEKYNLGTATKLPDDYNGPRFQYQPGPAKVGMW